MMSIIVGGLMLNFENYVLNIEISVYFSRYVFVYIRKYVCCVKRL